MRQNLDFTTLAILIVAVCGIALILILIRTCVLKLHWRPHHRERQGSALASGKPMEDLDRNQRSTIIDQLDSIERANKKQMQSLIAQMVESQDWRALGEQLSLLSDEEVEHLRVLAQRHNHTLSPLEALLHTREAFRTASLILSLYDELVADSDIVRDVLDQWFKMRRGTTIAQFSQKIHLDCARILLLDLEYASPPPGIIRDQLDLAEDFCSDVVSPDSDQYSPALLLLSEIALRKGRLTS
jgi:hypothetical protein